MPKTHSEVTEKMLRLMKDAALTESEDQIRKYFRQIMHHKGKVNKEAVCVYTLEQLLNA